MLRILKGVLQDRKRPSPIVVIRSPDVRRIIAGIVSSIAKLAMKPLIERNAPGARAVIPMEKRKAPIPFRSSIHWAGMFQERPPKETSVPMRANQKPGPNMLLIVHSQKFMLGDVA